MKIINITINIKQTFTELVYQMYSRAIPLHVDKRNMMSEGNSYKFTMFRNTIEDYVKVIECT